MKIVFLFLSFVIGSVSGAWADGPAVAAALPVATHIIWGGMVKSVSWADPAKGTKSEITVKDVRGKVTHILVTSTTTLWDADTKAIMPDKISVKSKVNVIYIISPEGINLAKAIKILK